MGKKDKAAAGGEAVVEKACFIRGLSFSLFLWSEMLIKLRCIIRVDRVASTL